MSIEGHPCYADHAWHGLAPVIENAPIARATYKIRLECPDLANRILPGQFLMVRLPGCNDPLLGRPLALYDTVLDDAARPVGVEVVYLVLGKFTSRLINLGPGMQLEMWGPLGNGFPVRPVDHLIMVAGGIGQTPFMALAQERFGRRQYGPLTREVPRARRISLCYGARTAELLAGVDEFREAGVEVHLSTDDGTAGHHGYVTHVLEELLEKAVDGSREVICCGPEPMMAAVAAICARRQVPCFVSLETPMACGIGICFSCVAKVRDQAGGWDYRRTCVEGPVFDAAEIVW